MNGREIKDYYKTLGISESATQDEVKKAYRKMAKIYHPDINSSKESEEKMKEINEAYEVLGNEKKRQEYENMRRLGAAGFSGFNFDAGGPSDFFTGGIGDIFDIFMGGGGGPRRDRPSRGSDLTTLLKISFEDAINGAVTKVPIHREVGCEKCNGSGAAEGTSPQTCPDCQGRGMIAVSQGVFSLSRTCPRCRGNGKVILNPCSVCHGSGRRVDTSKVTVKIPAGIDDGARIRVAGMGEAGTRNGPPGDLYIMINILPHPWFVKRGANIFLSVPVTYAEAALGSQIKIPTVSGKVTLKIPPGTQNEQVFRVKGKGSPKIKGIGRGDMFVSVKVTVPKKLNKKERGILKEFLEASGEDPRSHFSTEE